MVTRQLEGTCAHGGARATGIVRRPARRARASESLALIHAPSKIAKSREPEKTILSSAKKKRKYDEDYLKIRFTCKEDLNTQSHIRWLSKGRILAHFVELRQEIYLFLKDSDFNLKFRSEDETWLKRSNIFECFPLLREFITTNALSLDSEIRVEIILHLSHFSDELKRCFPDIDNAKNGWIRNPFLVMNESINSSLSIKQQESLLEMSVDMKKLFKLT
ncbi:Zinc finger BED domain-containing protein 5 [Eumeta japonica]|uniref:Zinc finger BED domain-containing protein 5 n=1 Tax=Eumeta variegata TaxID=151549 RepID=A0A4C1TZR6_EUMVA|nr:Zinc finger BED domain-containing protein 5 [Eumeta japonica]